MSNLSFGELRRLYEQTTDLDKMSNREEGLRKKLEAPDIEVEKEWLEQVKGQIIKKH